MGFKLLILLFLQALLNFSHLKGDARILTINSLSYIIKIIISLNYQKNLIKKYQQI